jgi:HlyD family secretion protein
MDVPKAKAKYQRKPALLVLAALLIGGALLGGLLWQPQGRYKIERSQLLLGKVQRGNLQLTIDGYGVLRSYKQRLLTALSAATVAEVV